MINEWSRPQRRAREALPAGELSDADLHGIARAEVSSRYHGLDRELAGALALQARGEAERHHNPLKRHVAFGVGCADHNRPFDILWPLHKVFSLTADASLIAGPGAVVPHAGICAGGRWVAFEDQHFVVGDSLLKWFGQCVEANAKELAWLSDA